MRGTRVKPTPFAWELLREVPYDGPKLPAWVCQTHQSNYQVPHGVFRTKEDKHLSMGGSSGAREKTWGKQPDNALTPKIA